MGDSSSSIETGSRSCSSAAYATFRGEDTPGANDAAEILAVLASQPTPQQVVALKPTDEMQARASELLRRSKAETLSRAEEAELDRYLYLEHLVRLAKARALTRRS